MGRREEGKRWREGQEEGERGRVGGTYKYSNTKQ